MKLWNPDYRKVVLGQILSLFANNILYFCLSLYVLDKTGSGVWFGSIMAVSLVPTLVLMPVGGVLSDRMNKRTLMLLLDVVILGTLLLSTLWGELNLAVIAAILIVLSVVEAFYSPCVQASVPLLQEPKHLTRANAIINNITMAANILGPMAGGMLYGFWGLEPVLSLCVASFFLSLVVKWFLKVPDVPQQPSQENPFLTLFSDIREAVRFLWKEKREILQVMPAIVVLNLCITPFVTVGLPYLIRIPLGMDSQVYGVAVGFVSGAGVVGGLLATLVADRLDSKAIYRLLLVISASILPVGLFPWMRQSPWTYLVLVAAALMIEQAVGSIFSVGYVSLIQAGTPQNFLGRVMALLITLSMVSEPVGRMVYGFLFEQFHSSIWPVVLVSFAIGILVTQKSRRALQKLYDERQVQPEE